MRMCPRGMGCRAANLYSSVCHEEDIVAHVALFDDEVAGREEYEFEASHLLKQTARGHAKGVGRCRGTTMYSFRESQRLAR